MAMGIGRGRLVQLKYGGPPRRRCPGCSSTRAGPLLHATPSLIDHLPLLLLLCRWGCCCNYTLHSACAAPRRSPRLNRQYGILFVLGKFWYSLAQCDCAQLVIGPVLGCRIYCPLPRARDVLLDSKSVTLTFCILLQIMRAGFKLRPRTVHYLVRSTRVCGGTISFWKGGDDDDVQSSGKHGDGFVGFFRLSLETVDTS